MRSAYLEGRSLTTDTTGAAPPDALGPFRVLHQIGAGTFGPVFHAYDQQRDRFVAVKVFTLNLTPVRTRQLVAQFEHLITADLAHPGIAVPVATGIAGTSAYLAHQFIEAEPFDAAIRQYGPAPPDEARRVATQLAGSLDFAAAVNILHGALHPADVLILPDETRLTGLGVTRALEHVGVVVPARRSYASPERTRGEAWDRRADVFTLAVLLHELLWGRRMTGTVTEVVSALTGVGGSDLATLRQAFARALADRGEDRFGTALEFVEAVGSAFPAWHAAGDSQPATSAEARRPELNANAAPVKAPATLDLDLREAEQRRYADAEVAPAVALEPARESPRRKALPTGTVAGAQPPIPIVRMRDPVSDPSQSRSMWPMAMILVLGIALGFVAGYGFKTPGESGGATANPRSESGRGAPPPVSPAVESAPAPPLPAGREFTEGAVPAPPKTEQSPAATEAPAKPEPAVPVAVEGRLLIRSEPAGATVIVDGREYGITPAIVRGLERGVHRVRVVREGYVPDERSVAVTRSQPAPSLLVTLEVRRPATERISQARPPPAPSPTIERYTGSLVVESLPAGATVFLDNKAVGRTPLALNGVNAGAHVVRLEHDGYHRWSRAIRVVAAERNRVTASLEQ
jgi:Protein kinase domain/PEGA domain